MEAKPMSHALIQDGMQPAPFSGHVRLQQTLIIFYFTPVDNGQNSVPTAKLLSEKKLADLQASGKAIWNDGLPLKQI